MYTNLAVLVFCLVIFSGPLFAQAITVEISATVPGCGDGAIGIGEQCDGPNIAGASCTSLGFTAGSLSCSSACTFDTASCTAGSLGGGGGRSPSRISIPLTNVVFTGRAYPRSTVTLLKDAQVVATTTAGADARFQMTISNVSGGTYNFSAYAEDTAGIRSSLSTFQVRVASGATTKVSDILIAPTVSADKNEIKQGDSVSISGQSAPLSEITITIDLKEKISAKTMSDTNGAYRHDFDTAVFTLGQYTATAKATVGGENTGVGRTSSFLVGTKNVFARPAPEILLLGDVTHDARVNLVDFSIAAYWYKRPNPPTSSDLNADGVVDLIDFSIMAFHWTG